MSPPPTLPPPISTRAELIAFAERLSKTTEVGFDTEFHAEQTYWPKVMLLQFSTPEEIALVDPLAPEVKSALGGFLELFRMREQTIIGHALERDLEIFLRLNGGLPVRIFDTQLAAAFVGHGGPIGLSALLQDRLGVEIKKLYSQADWGRRPLPSAQAGYAADDVRHLLPLAASLRADLEKTGRLDWLQEEQARLLDEDGYLPLEPEDAWRRVGRRPAKGTREHQIVVMVAAERERLAQETDRPPRRVLSDDVVVDLARRAPKNKKELDTDTLRRPAPNLEKYAKRWLEAVRRGLDAPLSEEEPDRAPLTPTTRAALEIAHVLARWVLERDGISAWLLTGLQECLERLLRSPATDRDGLKAVLMLEGWREELLIEPLWMLLGEGQPVQLDRGEGELKIHFGSGSDQDLRPPDHEPNDFEGPDSANSLP